MRRAFIALAVVAVVAAACGGGGSSGGSTDVPASIAVTLSAASGSASVTEGTTEASFSTSATVVITGKISTPVVADVQYDKTVFASGAAVSGPSGSYNITALTRPDLGGGEYKGTITFRLCQEAACTHVYAGTTVSYAYNIVVNLKDWAMYQRNPGHTGFVHAAYDATKFNKAWEWIYPLVRYSPVTTAGGRVFVTDTRTVPGTVYSIDDLTGVTGWAYSPPGGVQFSTQVVYGDDTLYAFSQNYPLHTVWTLDTLGAPRGSYAVNAPMAIAGQPTPYQGNLFLYAYGRGLTRVDVKTGSTLWVVQESVFASATETPTVDNNYVYYLTGAGSDPKGGGLLIVNIADGSLAKRIVDPNSVDYNPVSPTVGAPVIAENGNVLALTSTRSSPEKNRITCFNVPASKATWSTSNDYVTNPVVANGVVYSVRKDQKTLDAIDEANGNILWSWNFPSGSLLSDTNLPTRYGNLVLTDNLLFLSGTQTTYAVDIKSHQSVWSYPLAGSLSISKGNNLYIASSDRYVAIKLR